MINRTLVGAHYGLGSWIAQRVTAVVMAIYTAILVVLMLVVAPQDYESWRGIFAHGPMKLASLLFALSLAYHAWIGMRDIWMDYVKPTSMRLLLHVATIIWLVVCVIWAASILWRV